MFKLYSIIFCISILREINMLPLHAEVVTLDADISGCIVVGHINTLKESRVYLR
jgi:hypothetical protein